MKQFLSFGLLSIERSDRAMYSLSSSLNASEAHHPVDLKSGLLILSLMYNHSQMFVRRRNNRSGKSGSEKLLYSVSRRAATRGTQYSVMSGSSFRDEYPGYSYRYADPDSAYTPKRIPYRETWYETHDSRWPRPEEVYSRTPSPRFAQSRASIVRPNDELTPIRAPSAIPMTSHSSRSHSQYNTSSINTYPPLSARPPPGSYSLFNSDFPIKQLETLLSTGWNELHFTPGGNWMRDKGYTCGLGRPTCLTMDEVLDDSDKVRLQTNRRSRTWLLPSAASDTAIGWVANHLEQYPDTVGGVVTLDPELVNGKKEDVRMILRAALSQAAETDWEAFVRQERDRSKSRYQLDPDVAKWRAVETILGFVMSQVDAKDSWQERIMQPNAEKDSRGCGGRAYTYYRMEDENEDSSGAEDDFDNLEDDLRRGLCGRR